MPSGVLASVRSRVPTGRALRKGHLANSQLALLTHRQVGAQGKVRGKLWATISRPSVEWSEKGDSWSRGRGMEVATKVWGPTAEGTMGRIVQEGPAGLDRGREPRAGGRSGEPLQRSWPCLWLLQAREEQLPRVVVSQQRLLHEGQERHRGSGVQRDGFSTTPVSTDAANKPEKLHSTKRAVSDKMQRGWRTRFLAHVMIIDFVNWL